MNLHILAYYHTRLQATYIGEYANQYCPEIDDTVHHVQQSKEKNWTRGIYGVTAIQPQGMGQVRLCAAKSTVQKVQNV